MAVVAGGPQVRANRRVHSGCQGQVRGRCMVSRRAELASRAGTVISRLRMVPVVALARAVSVSVAAARVRLNAMTASTSQALVAVNRPLGRWARAEFFRSDGNLFDDRVAAVGLVRTDGVQAAGSHRGTLAICTTLATSCSWSSASAAVRCWA